jgi:hypothetical protein
MSIYAKVIERSRSYYTGVVLTTLEVRFHRFILAEVNTHRMFSRNSASSRAIPTHKRIESVMTDPAMPLEWGRNQKGMQAGELLPDSDAALCESSWIKARDAAVEHAQRLMKIGAHKQVVNRILEPFLWHTAVISSTDWDNWEEQRIHPDAQPEIRELARHMRDAMAVTDDRLVKDDFHTPYITIEEHNSLSTLDRIAISSARCAGTSYRPFDAGADEDMVAIAKRNLDLYTRLVSHRPMHASPLEHIAAPALESERPSGNFRGWHQWRHMVQLGQRLGVAA